MFNFKNLIKSESENSAAKWLFTDPESEKELMETEESLEDDTPINEDDYLITKLEKPIIKWDTSAVVPAYPIDDEDRRNFPNGAYIITKYSQTYRKFTVIGTAPYVTGSLEEFERVKKEHRQRKEEFGFDTDVKDVHPSTKTYFLREPIFYTQGNNSYELKFQIKKLSYIFKVPYDEILVIIGENSLGFTEEDYEKISLEDYELKAVYGVTIEQDICKKLKDEFDASFEVEPFYDYKTELRKIDYTPPETAEWNAENSTNNEFRIKQAVNTFIKECPYKDFYKNVTDMIYGQPDVEYITVAAYAYLKSIAKGSKVAKTNAMIIGDTGTGKTQTYRAIKECLQRYDLNIPVYQIDFSLVTEEGFKGRDVNYILDPLFEADTNGIGIVFVDEFDKKILPSCNAYGDNINLAIQNQILSIIEGIGIKGNGRFIDTNNTLFIFSGAFHELKKNKEDVKHMGFLTQNTTEIEADRITREDLIKFGASPELIGRISVIANYGPLDNEVRKKILQRDIAHIEESLDIKIEATKKFIEHIITSKFEYGGARDLYNILTPIVFRAYAKGLRFYDTFSVTLDIDKKKEITTKIKEIQLEEH